MKEGKSKIGIGIGLGLIGVLILVSRAKAAPPEGYVCPYCGLPFSSFEELVEHVQTEHPGQRIPIDIEWE